LTLSRRALNRATLDRQLLLRRHALSAMETIEHLVGMQAQNPQDPYFGLWARLDGFDANELSHLIAEREALRVPFLRGTIHLATSVDCLTVLPLMQSVRSRIFRSSQFAKDTAGVDMRALLAAGRSLLEERPRRAADLGRLLAEQWPDRVPSSLAYAITFLVPVVQVPPRGLWKRTGQPTWTSVEYWLGRKLPKAQSPEDLVSRYLAAFGPAAVKDMRVWCGLAGLTEVVEQLRPRLRTFRDETGSELFDLPEAPRPDPNTPAPPRFLPEYDNMLLSHSDRSRFFEPGIFPKGWVGNLLHDGLFCGSWKIERSRDNVHLNVTLEKKLSKSGVAEIAVEGDRLLAFTDPDTTERDVRVANR
jgi:hypothetical protein